MDAASRVWLAALWPRSMWSGSSAQLASKLVWRPPRHGVVAVPGKVRVSGAGMDPLRSEKASLDRMQGRRSRPAAGGATSGFWPNFEVRRGALAPPLRACMRLKQADSLLQVPIRTQYGLDCMGPATRHAGGRQTSLLASCAELPDHIDRGHTAASHTLLASSI